MAICTGARDRRTTRQVSELPPALAHPPVQIVRLVFVPIRTASGTRHHFMLNRFSHCECSYWLVHNTIRPWGDPAPGSPEISAHSPASPNGMRDRALSQSSGPGRGTTVRGRGTGESGVPGVAVAGPKVRLAGDGDSGAGLIRCGRARSASPARRQTSLAIRHRAGSRWKPGRVLREHEHPGQVVPYPSDGLSSSRQGHRRPARRAKSAHFPPPTNPCAVDL